MAGVRGRGTKVGRGGQSPRVEEGDVFSTLTELLRPINERLDGLNQLMAASNQSMAKQQQQIAELVKKSIQTDEKLKETAHDTKKMRKKVGLLEQREDLQERKLLNLQMEKANKVLRFQGVAETAGENLKEVAAELIASALGNSSAEALTEIEVVYRSYSKYIKQHNMPGEIVVKFLRRQTRDDILKATAANPLQLGSATIRVLKDIPFEVRQKRKAYKELISTLQINQIPYSWLYLEGVQFKYKDKRGKIDSVFKAEEWLKQFFGSKEQEQPDGGGPADNLEEMDEEPAGAVGGVARDTYDLRLRVPK